DTENDPRSSQLDNIDKNVGRIRKDMLKMFEGFNNQNGILLYLLSENKLMHDWIFKTVCPTLKLSPPPLNPTPNALAFPQPDDSSTSDNSSSSDSE
ncbi:hypothetical protein L195_g058091, partial [Trifolium pratense]